MKLLFLPLLLLLTQLAYPQASNPITIVYVTTAPSGACSSAYLPIRYVVPTTGALYGCLSGVWTALSGGGGGTGTVTSVDASGGVQTVSGSAITATGTIRGAWVVNAQTGTTYTVLTGDRGKLVTLSNASSIAVTLPSAASGSFAPTGWFTVLKNIGAGTVTITPTTSTIDGTTTLTLLTGEFAIITSDGTNYETANNKLTAGSNVTITPSRTGHTIAASGGGSGSIPFTSTRTTTSASNDTISLNCSTSPYCAIRVNGVVVYTSTTNITAQLSGTSNTSYLYTYYTPSTNTIYCDENTTSTLTVAGCTAASTGGIPAGSIPIGKTTGTYAFTANAFADPSTSPQGPLISWSKTENGTGISCSTDGTTGVQTCSIDITVVPTISDIRAGVHVSVADTSSSSTTYTGCPSIPIGSYTSGMPVQFKPANTNSGSSTLELCLLGQKTIQKLVSGTLTNLASGDMDSDSWHYLMYNGTVFVKVPMEGGSTAAAVQPSFWLPGGYTEPVVTRVVSVAANDTSYIPFSPDVNMDIRSVAFGISTASGTCGGTCGMKIGIYNSSGNLVYQTAALTSGGTPNINSTGYKVADFTSTVSLTAGATYWIAFTTDSTVLEVYNYSGAATAGVGNDIITALIGSVSTGTGNDSTGSGGSIALNATKGTVTRDTDRHVYFGLKY